MYFPDDAHIPYFCDWKTGCKFQEQIYVDGGNSNDWHFVTIANPSGDGLNFTWSNRAGVKWDLTASRDPKSGILKGFDVGKNCPYYNNGHKYAEFVWNPKSQLISKVKGPWNEPYTLVNKFAI
tara:strand:+ start:248 stop:616 length:369 start_codon:yes stop_codon:yes gene_type:complete